MLFAEFGWPHAITAVGVAAAFTGCVWAFFWMIANTEPTQRRQLPHSKPLWTYETRSGPDRPLGGEPAVRRDPEDDT